MTYDTLNDCLLIVGILVATVLDQRFRRIPNWLIGAGLIITLSIHFLNDGFSGIIFSAKGFAVGMSLLLVPFVVGGIGAGDVKLLGLVGAVKGAAFAANAFLWMAVWGGLMAVIVLFRNGQLGSTLMNLLPGSIKYTFSLRAQTVLAKKHEKVVYPYALAITLGVFCAYWKGWW